MTKKLKKISLILVVVSLLGFGFLPLPSSLAANVHVEFPTSVGTTASKIPIRVRIDDPHSFGFPRIPSEIRISVAGFRERGVIISLLSDVDLNPLTISNYLNNPIEIETELPLPIHKIGFYRIVVDVKCIYGPSYRSSYWYSYTINYPLQIVSERIHIVGVIQKGNYIKALGYSFTQAQIYDFLGRGISYKAKVLVKKGNDILYEEGAAEIIVFFEHGDNDWFKKEETELKEKYNFLLSQYPETQIEILFEKIGEGNWRFLFGLQPESWIEKYGVVVEAALPTVEGISYFPGLSKIEWPGYRWNPIGEFQLELLPVGIP